MTLSQNSVRLGNWLFVRRGWLPAFLYLVATLAIVTASPDQLFRWSFTQEISFLLLSCLGLVIRALTIGYTPMNTSGRNTKVGQVADSLNTLGMYSIVRHPLYVGNFFMWLGLVLYVGVDWFIPIIMLLYWWYYEKIVMAEEDFLSTKFGDVYTQWCDRTNAFFPKFSQWKRPSVDMSIRNIVKREYHGAFYLVLSFVFINALRNFVFGETEIVDQFWLYTLGITAGLAIIIRILAKKTSFLNKGGR